MTREYPSVQITEKGERFLKGGHVWVYADEVTSVAGDPEDGAIADVYSKKGRYLGTGFFNSRSKIRVRIFTKNANDRPDDAFWERKLRWALQYRKDAMGETDFRCCRLIFGEADAFPGLTVDRFENVLVSQVLCLGTDRIKDRLYSMLLRLLQEEFGTEISVLYERNDVAIRELEGMEQYTGFWHGDGLSDPAGGVTANITDVTANAANTAANTIVTAAIDTPAASVSASAPVTTPTGKTEIVENGIRYEVDYIHGQKTGFFLDQKYNRRAIRTLAEGKRVLDCFTHTGSFALNAAAAGASHVTAVDISADALALAKENALRNGLCDRMDFVRADVFDLLTEMAEHGKCDYDLIILDPPAFTKSRDTLEHATRGYKEINLKAMRLLRRGGYLATCSCSHFMDENHFRRMLHDAAADAGVSLRQLEARQQAPDHPILWNVPETDYLKFFIFQVV